MNIDQRANLATVWAVLEMAREDCISEDENGPNDEQWQDVCSAMAQLGEGLGIDESGEAIAADHEGPCPLAQWNDTSAELA
jgi:hypothetical protein